MMFPVYRSIVLVYRKPGCLAGWPLQSAPDAMSHENYQFEKASSDLLSSIDLTMAYGRRIKTEMRGDTSRYGHREYVKRAANRLRRRSSRLVVAEDAIEAMPDRRAILDQRRTGKS